MSFKKNANITDCFDAGGDKEQLLITTILRFPLLFFICSPISASV